jgi:DNA repair protein RecO (recombination protein O)
LDRISYASYLVEITDGLIGEREENPAVFQHLKEALCQLAAHGSSLRFLTAFELKLLRLSGYQPVLDACKKCRQHRVDEASSGWHFSTLEGGILCDPCSRSARELLPVGPSALELLTALQEESIDLVGRRSLPMSVVKEIRTVIMRFIQFHMDREIKSAPFLHPFSSV